MSLEPLMLKQVVQNLKAENKENPKKFLKRQIESTANYRGNNP